MNYTNSSAAHRDIIRASHKRSLDLNVERERVQPTVLVRGAELETRLKKNMRLLKIATPFVHLLYEFVSDTGFVVLLTDDQGCIIEIVGDEELIGNSKPYGLGVGAFMSEESIGSNAISIALHENRPIQVNGKEHFVNGLHQWSCSAAPIHDEKGNTIGCINLSGVLDKVLSYILGLVVSSAKAIEFQIKSSFSEMRQKEAYHFVSQILNTLEFGVLATDTNGKIRRANNLASRLYCALHWLKLKTNILKNFLIHGQVS
jgi:sigma-54 dependent transcriptional regulator, acetoin dehydrogenase operon transcriptional activator AcoR